MTTAMNKRTLTTALAKHVVNPLVEAAVEHGFAPPSYAILETTGRKSGRPRRTPVGNGFNAAVVRALGTDLLTVRIDLAARDTATSDHKPNNRPIGEVVGHLRPERERPDAREASSDDSEVQRRDDQGT